jgi:hypothetical protein
LSQEVGIDLRLEARGKLAPLWLVAGRLPVEDLKSPIWALGDEVVGRDQRIARDLAFEGDFGVGPAGLTDGFSAHILVPPDLKLFVAARLAADRFPRHPAVLLAEELMEADAPLLAALVFTDGFGLRGRVGPPFDVPQQKAPRAVVEVLEAPLAELEVLREERSGVFRSGARI